MKRIIYCLLISLLFWNCAHRITRTGYQVKKSDYKFCEVVIQRFTTISDTVAKKIGEIELDDSGVSTSCSEVDAINILKGEACALNADLIIIVWESRPGLGSTCYSCKAEFYKFDTSTSIKGIENDQDYNQDKLQQRVSDDRKRNTIVFIGSLVAVILLFLLMPW